VCLSPSCCSVVVGREPVGTWLGRERRVPFDGARQLNGKSKLLVEQPIKYKQRSPGSEATRRGASCHRFVPSEDPQLQFRQQPGNSDSSDALPKSASFRGDLTHGRDEELWSLAAALRPAIIIRSIVLSTDVPHTAAYLTCGQVSNSRLSCTCAK
jgi:hypothetical protein